MLFQKFIPENGCVISETACGHEGQIDKLYQLIDCAVDGGAKIIKFQIYYTYERAIEGQFEWDLFSKSELKPKEWDKAVQYARQKNLIIFADVFGKASLAFAHELGVDGFKIHSEDLLNTYFIAEAASLKKVLIIGVGGAHRIEMYSLLNFLKKRDLLHNVVLMTGVQTFPTPLDAHSLDEISDLISIYSSYGVKVGFSDHVAGDLEEAKVIPLMALAKGAAVIEKHITVNRDDKWTDYHSALSKKDFKSFMEQVRKFSPLLGKVGRLNDF